MILYLYLYVDGLEGTSLKCPYPHQNKVFQLLRLLLSMFIQSILEAIHSWGIHAEAIGSRSRLLGSFRQSGAENIMINYSSRHFEHHKISVPCEVPLCCCVLASLRFEELIPELRSVSIIT